MPYAWISRSAKTTAVLGRNGTGKTTLLKTLMGLTDRMEGQINLNGTEIGKEPTFRRARAGIAYVPQGREIIPDFSIRENILMGAFARSDGKREIPELVPELFPYLMDNLERPGGVLSGGQQQQLAIARALAADPGSSCSTSRTKASSRPSSRKSKPSSFRLNREVGLTVVLVEQNVMFARQASHCFAMMEKGRIVVAGAISRTQRRNGPPAYGGVMRIIAGDHHLKSHVKEKF